MVKSEKQKIRISFSFGCVKNGQKGARPAAPFSDFQNWSKYGSELSLGPIYIISGHNSKITTLKIITLEPAQGSAFFAAVAVPRNFVIAAKYREIS